MATAKNNNKQLLHKVKTTSYISLPYEMVEDIKSLNLSKQYEAYAFKFVGLIMRNNWMNDRDLFDYSEELSTQYIKDTFNGELYTKWLFPLLESEIIIRDDIFYFGEDNKILFYKLNIKYFKSSLILIGDNIPKPLQTLGYSDITTINSKDSQYINWFKNDMLSLSINQDKLMKIVENKITSIKESDFIINENIIERQVPMTSNGKVFYMTRENAIAKAKEQNKDLIKDGKRYVIDTLQAHIAKKKESVRVSYTNAIMSLEMKDFRASRNNTNNRLDTNLTNLCSDLTDMICEDNKLVQLDLNNSQFTLLTNILTGKLDTEDFKRFKALTIEGKLYNHIKENLGLETIKQGKMAAFEILFSSRNNNTTNKAKLKQLFPSVIKWIDDFKKENGDEAFSIMLQKFESKIFIDSVLTKIKKQKLFCVTKHDSVIVREKDLDKVMSLLEAEFGKINLEYKLDIKGTKIVAEIEEMKAPELNERQLKMLAKYSGTRIDETIEEVEEELKPSFKIESKASREVFFAVTDNATDEMYNEYLNS